MDNNKFCVSWNPGTFGNLIKSAIIIQKFDSNASFDIKKHDSHDIVHDGVSLVHPHNDSEIPHNSTAIKPYFEMKQLAFFPKYLHYLKWFKTFPDKKTIKNYYDTDDDNFYKSTVRIYWNTRDSVSKKCFNIKMDNFFCNFDHFIVELESYMEEKLKDQTLNFLQIKKNNNLPLFQNFTNNVVNSVNCLTQSKSRNIQHLSEYEKLLIICTHVQGNWKLTNKFLKNYNYQEIVDVMDIYTYVHGK